MENNILEKIKEEKENISVEEFMSATAKLLMNNAIKLEKLERRVKNLEILILEKDNKHE